MHGAHRVQVLLLRRSLEHRLAAADVDEVEIQRLGDGRIRKAAFEQGLHDVQARHAARLLGRHHAGVRAVLRRPCTDIVQLLPPLFHRRLCVHAASFFVKEAFCTDGAKSAGGGLVCLRRRPARGSA
jgi:hypothetical protein